MLIADLFLIQNAHAKGAVLQSFFRRVVGQHHIHPVPVPLQAVFPRALHGVVQGKGHGILKRLVLGVFDLHRVKPGRKGGIFLIQRDKRVKGPQSGPAREGAVQEIHLGEGEPAHELAVLKMRHAREQIARGAKAVIGVFMAVAEHAHVRGLQIRVQHPGVQHPAAIFHLDRKVGKSIDAALVGPVEDLPIPKASGSVQADAARPHPAHGKADLLAFFTSIYKSRHALALHLPYSSSTFRV